MSVSGSAFDFNLFRRTFSYARPYRTLFFLSITITLVGAFLSPLRPYLVQYTIDNFVVGKNYSGLLKFTLIIGGLILFESFLQLAGAFSGNLLGLHVVHDIRMSLYRKVLRFKSTYFDNTPVGTLVTRAVSDILSIADVFSQGFLEIAGDLLKISIIISVMLFTNWKITLISLSTIPLLFIATNIFKNAIKDAFQDVRNQVARLNTFVQEHINGMATVQLFNREEKEFQAFKEINKMHRDAHIRSVWHYSVFFPVVEILSAVSIGLLIWWGAGEAIKGEVSIGVLTSFIMYINMLFRPIRMLADRFNTLQMAMVCSERVFKVMDAKEEEKNEGEIVVEHLKGRIEFREVSFEYKENNPVLQQVSFQVETGQTLAIVGATGSGKTTIASLLFRFYEINKGQILIDNVDIKSYRLENLRKNIGLVMQDVFLFPGSIYDNITLGDYSITKATVMDAASKVGIVEFIEQLPGGLDFDVRERGTMLSAGQRQLIAFLRVYVYNPSILILDEATSNIDSETELLISKATLALTKGRTSVIIAHRLSTIQNAEKILVIDKGRLVEQGNHKELRNNKGLYETLYTMQFKAKEPIHVG
jgi:ATP-binding cassette, subfamily B, multidrug efflux pump